MKKTAKPLRATRTHKVTRKDNPTASTARRTAKPTTAYELLQRVCEHILEEPRRYYQNQWAVVGAEAVRSKFGDRGPDPIPPCGTVACRAGWIVGLHDGLEVLAVAAARSPFDKGSVGPRASSVLGMTTDDTRPLFDGDWDHGDQGMKRHAQFGVRGLRAFMKKHAAHLKARLLKDVPHV